VVKTYVERERERDQVGSSSFGLRARHRSDQSRRGTVLGTPAVSVRAGLGWRWNSSARRRGRLLVLDVARDRDGASRGPSTDNGAGEMRVVTGGAFGRRRKNQTFMGARLGRAWRGIVARNSRLYRAGRGSQGKS
jgi:hypothetical protein